MTQCLQYFFFYLLHNKFNYSNNRDYFRQRIRLEIKITLHLSTNKKYIVIVYFHVFFEWNLHVYKLAR